LDSIILPGQRRHMIGQYSCGILTYKPHSFNPQFPPLVAQANESSALLQSTVNIYTQYLHSVSTLSIYTQYLHSVSTLSTYTQYLHSVSTLSIYTQYLHSVPTLSIYTQYLHSREQSPLCLIHGLLGQSH